MDRTWERIRRGWLDIPVRIKGVLVVAIPLVALLAVVGMSLSLQFQERSARAASIKASAVVTAAQNSLVLALNAETGVRGYAATGDPGFLSPYTTAVGSFPAVVAALELAGAQNGQQSAVAPIRENLTDQFALFGRIRRAVAAGGGVSALDSQLAAGKVSMDRLRAMVVSVAGAGSTFTLAQRAEINRIESRGEAVDIAGLILGLLGGLIGISLFAAGIGRRVSAAAANAHRLGEGQPLVLSPLAGDELGRLAMALDRAEQILTRRGAEVASARDEALAASQAKTRFLSRTSHELRTPLNAMLGFGQLLEFSALTDEDQDSVAHILTAGRHLVGLINDVMDISLIESGEMTLSVEPVSVAATVAEAIALMRPLAAAQSISVYKSCPDPDLSARADQQRLRQILLNLVSNAIKYNREGGSVTLSCGGSEVGWIDITVADTGSGMTEAQLQRLFVPFERLGAEQTQVEGTGIGLALTKTLTEVMGGTLQVESTLGEGSVFTVRLPRAVGIALRARRSAPKLTPAARVGGVAASRVLYIEDNLASVQVIERLLANRSNTTLYVAMSGQIGIDLARQHRPTVILLDLHLPDLAGDMVLQRLRLDPTTQHIPVVILSADANASSIGRLLDAGATSYLTKPVNLHELLTLLETTAEPAALVVASPAPTERATNTVLYIEDSTLNTDLAARLVERRTGIQLVVAHSGQNGLQMARAQRPDLVLLDRRLPDMDGDDILAALKASPDTSSVPVVVLSGDSGRSQIDAMLAAGANEFLAKPFSAQDFLGVLDHWCPPELRQE